MGVSENKGTPKSSILIGVFIINHPFWGIPIFGNPNICLDYKNSYRYVDHSYGTYNFRGDQT